MLRLGALSVIQTDLRSNYPNTAWIQGHLLNGQLSGPNKAKNLTMITQSANTSMTAVENSVRNIVGAAYRAIRGSNPTYHYGVEYEVKTNGLQLGTTPPLSHVSTKVQGRAKSKKKLIGGNSIVNTDGTDNQMHQIDIPWTDFVNVLTPPDVAR
jgi:hypothetical protein